MESTSLFHNKVCKNLHQDTSKRILKQPEEYVRNIILLHRRMKIAKHLNIHCIMLNGQFKLIRSCRAFFIDKVKSFTAYFTFGQNQPICQLLAIPIFLYLPDACFKIHPNDKKLAEKNPGTLFLGPAVAFQKILFLVLGEYTIYFAFWRCMLEQPDN